MKNTEKELINRISTSELDRRWDAVRQMMNANGIDYLIVRNDEDYLGGNIKWFCDTWAQNGYPLMAVFPVDDEITLIAHGPDMEDDPSPKNQNYGIKARLTAPHLPSLNYSAGYEAELAMGILKKKKGALIGLVGKSFIPVSFIEHLQKHLPDLKFVDVTELIDEIKVIKSPEEIAHIRVTAGLHDLVIEHIRKIIKPGIKAYEVYAEARYAATVNGSEQGIVMVGSGPSGSPIPFMGLSSQNRVLKEGDQLSVLIEINGPSGFYAEIGRVFSIGEPSQELQDAFETSLEAQKIVLEMMRPGVSPKDLLDASNNFLEKHGYFPEKRLFAHGQGYDLVERPAIRADDPMLLKAGMNIAVHPCASNKSVWAVVCDNYIVTEGGVSECLHKTPKEVIVV